MPMNGINEMCMGVYAWLLRCLQGLPDQVLFDPYHYETRELDIPLAVVGHVRQDDSCPPAAGDADSGRALQPATSSSCTCGFALLPFVLRLSSPIPTIESHSHNEGNHQGLCAVRRLPPSDARFGTWVYAMLS